MADLGAGYSLRPLKSTKSTQLLAFENRQFRIDYHNARGLSACAAVSGEAGDWFKEELQGTTITDSNEQAREADSMKFLPRRPILYSCFLLFSTFSLPVSGLEIALSTTSTNTLGGLTFRNGDVAHFDDVSGTTLFFSEDNFTGNVDVDALHYRAPTQTFVLSTESTSTIGGLTFRDGDLVEYNPLTDTATLIFNEDLFASGEDIDAVHILPNGNFVLSTTSNAILGGIGFTDGDLVEYNPLTAMASLFFSEANFGGGEDIDAVMVLDNGNIVLSTQTAASLGGLSFDEGDLVEYDPLADIATLFFDGSQFSLPADINAVSVPEPAGWLMLAQVFFAGCFFTYRRWRNRPISQPAVK